MADCKRKTANLFDKDNKDYSLSIYPSTSGIVTERGDNPTLSFIIPVIPATTYTISKDVTTRRRIAGYSDYPTIGMASDFVTEEYSTINNRQVQTFTTGENTHYILYFVSTGSTTSEQTANAVAQSIQLEIGSVMSAYEPYYIHSLRKLTTAAEAVESTLYSDGTAITSYTIKGNTVQDGTPTPENPIMPQGTGERTGNLFDGTLITGFYDSDINNINPDNPSYRSFRIQGLPAGQYTVSWNIPVKLVRAYYDGVLYENAGDGLTSYTVTSSDGDIAFSFRDATSPSTPWSDSNTVMLNTGSTVIPYEPYGYKIPIISKGINLFDKDNADIVDLYPSAATKEIEQSVNLSTWSIILPVESSTTYTFTMGELTTAFKRRVGMCSDYPTKGAYCTSVDDTPEYDNPNLGNTFTTDADTKYILIMYVSGASRDVAIERANQVQVVKGNTALPYEPYVQPTISNIYLGNVQTTRYVRKSVFDGTENWEIRQEGTDNAFVMLQTGDSAINHQIVATHYSQVTIALANTTTGIDVITQGHIRIRTSNASSMSVSDFKSFLAQQYAAGTPVTVWYVLATEITGIVNEPLMKIGDYADMVSNVAQIPTTRGTNLITVDTTIQPSEFTATWTGWHNAYIKEYASDTDNLTSFPALIYASGEPLIDYAITGNTGGVAARTANYFDKNNIDIVALYPNQSTGAATVSTGDSYSIILPVDFVSNGNFWIATTSLNRLRVAGYETYPVEGTTATFVDNSTTTETDYRINPFIIPSDSNTNYIMVFLTSGQGYTVETLRELLQSIDVMCSQGANKLPYVPYYCIPVQLSCSESEWEEVLVNTFTDKTTEEANGLTVTVSNGSITVNGTASANTNLVLVNNATGFSFNSYQVLDNGIYVLDGNPIDAAVNKYILSYRYDPDGAGTIPSALGRVDVGTSSEINNLNGAYQYFAMYIAIWKNSVLDNVVFTPSIKQKAVGTTLYIDSPLELTDTLTYTQTGIAIPTFDGDNTITFGTTVQPSAMSAEYKGWHS